MRGVIGYVIALVALLALDFVWLSLTGESLYRPAMGSLELARFHPAPAVGFYLIYALGLSVLVVNPAVEAAGPVNLRELTFKAAVFGLAAFATYDLTGLAVIRDWPRMLSLIDMGWGTFAAAVSANLTVLGLRLLGQVKSGVLPPL
jgi:uncharacterized membrane protein